MKYDFSIFDQFSFERQPVGVKFRFEKPEGLDQLDKTLAFCEMLPQAQKGTPLYVTKDQIGIFSLSWKLNLEEEGDLCRR